MLAWLPAMALHLSVWLVSFWAHVKMASHIISYHDPLPKGDLRMTVASSLQDRRHAFCYRPITSIKPQKEESDINQEKPHALHIFWIQQLHWEQHTTTVLQVNLR